MDQPGILCPSFRRLKKKKTSVPPIKQVGRAVKQLSATGKLTGGHEKAKELYASAAFGLERGPGFRPFSNKQVSRAAYVAVRTGLRRLCERYPWEVERRDS